MAAYLCHDGHVLPQTRERLLVAHLEIHVDQLVRERGEFITEADDVDPRVLRRERVRIELHLDLFVNDLAFRVLQVDVDIVLPPRHNLEFSPF
jgi:hypothetical protein